MKTTEWMNGSKIDATMNSNGLDLMGSAEDLERTSWSDAADTYEVAADCFETAGNKIAAIRMRANADRCRVWAA